MPHAHFGNIMRPETLFGEHEIFPLPSQNDPAKPDHFAHTVSSSTQLTSEKVHHSSTERTLPSQEKEPSQVSPYSTFSSLA